MSSREGEGKQEVARREVGVGEEVFSKVTIEYEKEL